MLRLHYFFWPHGPSVPLHFNRLRQLFPEFESVATIVKGSSDLLDFRSDILYLIGHSTKKKGMVLADGNSLSASFLSDLISQAHHYKPQLVFLNTCYGIESGMAKALKNAGVTTVIAANGPILIKHMTLYAERFFQCWADDKQAVSHAVKSINQEFKDKEIQFTSLGNGRMTFRSLSNF
ncbi:MAG: hypothetical protein ABJO02_00970 [Reichenbachiella sp.]|uniref:hypothetical protein n=1 Tax=Reichenbachiella sp. TaxID=2184521 RepID=UPI00329A4783